MPFPCVKYLPLMISTVKSFIDNAKHNHKVRTFDQTKEKINTIEHSIIKLDKKIGEARNEIEDLRRQVVFSMAINVVLGIIIIFLLLFLRS